jgi:hypothetical protein
MSTPAPIARDVARRLLEETEEAPLHGALAAIDTRGDVAVPRPLLQEAIDRLARCQSSFPDGRKFAAQHRSASAETLARLSDDDVEIRKAVAKNSATPVDVVERLAEDDDVPVRAAAAANPRLGPDMLARLLADQHLWVRKEAAGNPSTPAAAVETYRAELERRRSSAHRSHDDLVMMAADTRVLVRKQAAYAPEATPDILILLGGERASKQVRRIIASRPDAPGDLLRAMATRDDDAETLQAIAYNSATPPDVLVDLAGRNRSLAIIVALNGDAPPTVHAALEHDSDPMIRFVARSAVRQAETTTGIRRRAAPELGPSVA